MDQGQKNKPAGRMGFNKLRSASFSKPQLLIFVLVFAIIGYALFRTFAAAPLVTSLEAEQMSLPAGGSVISDSTASGGKAVKLVSNGTATGSVNFPSSVNSLTVLAKGDQCSGAPTMTVALDGTNLLSGTAVSATSWTAYSFTPNSAWASGTHNLSISFNNAYSNTTYKGNSGKIRGTCTRALYADVTNFYGPATITPAPTLALSASPVSVLAGSASTLTWTSTNATSCTASGAWSGSQPTSGSVSTGAVNQTSTYSLTCTGAGGSATASTTVGLFTTSLTQGMTITPAYTWTFNPGIGTTKGYFYADGNLLATAAPDATGAYTFAIQSSTLTAGSHTLGHGFDLSNGSHYSGPASYSVTISSGTTSGGGGSGTGSCTYSNGATNSAWCSAINFAVPSFTPTRTVNVTSQSAFMTAWNNIQPGDQINVSGVTFTGQVNLTGKNLSNWAQISFDSATKFTGYAGVANNPIVYLQNDSHIRFYGGDLSESASNDQAGFGLLVHGNVNYVSWWDFRVHDTGNTAFAVFPAEGPSSNLDFRGEAYSWGHNLSWDPHAEKGTGMHGVNLSDAAYSLTNSRVAIYAHDGPTGAGLELGSDTASSTGNTIYAWCQNLTFVAKSQVAGNCIQYWGTNTLNNVIKYDEAENLQGRPFDANGVYGGQSLSTDSIQYGIASNTNQNPYLSSTEPNIGANVKWDTRYGPIQLLNVSPLP